MYKNVVLIILFCLLFSCQEEDEFKIPVDVNFTMDINRDLSSNGFVQFNYGQIILKSFKFYGEREQASDVTITRAFEKGLALPFDAHTTISELNFEIPQGIYKNLTIEFETKNTTAEPSLMVKGDYNTINGNNIPIKFETSNSIFFEKQGETQNGTSEIVIRKEVPATVNIKLDPIYWFQNVPLMKYENAELNEINNIPTININEERNGNIYTLIVARIGIATEVLITE